MKESELVNHLSQGFDQSPIEQPQSKLVNIIVRVLIYHCLSSFEATTVRAVHKSDQDQKKWIKVQLI